MTLHIYIILSLVGAAAIVAICMGYIRHLFLSQHRLLEELNKKNQERFLLLQQLINHESTARKSELSLHKQEILSELQKIITLTHENNEKNRDLMSNHFNQLFQLVTHRLHETIDKKLGETFLTVSQRLDLVHKGLGEMQGLAQNVSDIKQVFHNVKTKGMWGEVQLEALIEQYLAPSQYKKHVNVNPKTAEAVEFAVVFPGNRSHVLLPVDAKFPHKLFENIVQAEASTNKKEKEKAKQALKAKIFEEAKQIQQKYICPPTTTDFAILFIPVESMYLEVIQMEDVVQTLQQQHQVVVSGPTTFMALLHSLQIGFKSLAVEQRSAEIRDLLIKVKSEFKQFGVIIEKTHKKLEEAGDNLNLASKKSKQLTDNLTHVEWIE